MLFTATGPHARETEGYEQRNKEMKVVFSPNLHLSVYPGPVLFTATEPHAREQREYTK